MTIYETSTDQAQPRAEEPAVDSDAGQREMRDLKDFLSKLNPMVEEFVPPTLASPVTVVGAVGAGFTALASHVRGIRTIEERVANKMAQIQDNNFDLEDKLSAFFAPKPFVGVNFILLMSVWKMQWLQVSSVSWCSHVSLMMLILSSVLQLVGISTPNNGSGIRRRCKIAYLSTVVRMVAAASLLLFLGKAHTVVVVPLLLTVLTSVALFWRVTFNYPNEKPGNHWGAFREQLNHHFDLSAEVVSLAFAGLIGTVLFYVKGPSHQMTGGYMAPECFLFYAAVLGLLVMLLCTVPARVEGYARGHMARAYLPILAYASLLFLVLAGVMVAEEILRQYVFLVCFAFVLLAMACLLHDHNNHVQFANAAGEQNINQYIQAGYSLCCFAALMATRLKYSNGSGGTVSTSWGLKGSVLSALSGILTYVVRMVVSTVLPNMQIPTFTKKVWLWGIYLSIAGTFVCILVVVLLKLDEVQNII